MFSPRQFDLPVLPRLRAICEQVIAAWHVQSPAPEDWPAVERLLAPPAGAGAAPGREPRWEALTRRLQWINTFQWHEEDRSRAHGAGDAVLGAVKRSIDASNRRRVQTIDALDAHLFELVAGAGLASDDAPLHSETPASIIDRLTVLALKRFHLAEDLAAFAPADAGRDVSARAADSDPAAAAESRLAMVHEQFEDLAGCLARLLDDIRAGRVRLKLYRQVKIYRDEATGRLRNDVP